ncbi:MAG: flagellar hook-associated protein 3 [Spirochaetaceae bacterium]|nr:flagellar hook-associated protein 3 [Spirochaetaceae bacterium]
MRRISTNMGTNELQRNMRKQEYRLNKLNNQLGNQQRIQNLRDDPIAAGHLVRYQSYVSRINQFTKNAQTLTDKLTVAEGYIDQSVQILQRVREMAVQGANGIYSQEDLKNMAVEVDELLKELVQNGNAVNSEGSAIFGGTSTNRTAFDVISGPVDGSSVSYITEVHYNGSIDGNKFEVDENAYIDFVPAGNRIFWAENQQLYSERDATGYRVANDSVISIDGKEIKINAGDNVYSIIAKINNSDVAIKASIDPLTNGLNLSTTDAHQLWLRDESGSVLNDLGIIKDATQRPPYNLATSTKVSGGSVFDAVIALRNAMLAGDTETIGGKALGAIDQGLDNLITRLAETGAQYERAQQNITRNEKTALDTTSRISREGDVDFSQAVTDLKLLEYVQKATFSTASKLYSTSLLDYMR